MPKKFQSENSKSVAAKTRRAAVQAEKDERIKREKEDALWRDDDKHINRKLQRKEEEERKRLEAIRRKEQNREMYEEDLRQAAAKKHDTPQKITRAALTAQHEAEQKLREEEEERRRQEATKIHIPSAVIEENLNRLDLDAHAARNVDDAIRALNTSSPLAGPGGIDRHPEKRLKNAFAAFEDRRLPELKNEHPNFRLSQLKQLLKREWQRSPENPLNQNRVLHMA